LHTHLTTLKVSYCSPECQKADWGAHKKTCPSKVKANCFLIRASHTKATDIEPFPLKSYGDETAEMAELKRRLGWSSVVNAGQTYDHKGTWTEYYYIYGVAASGDRDADLRLKVNKLGSPLCYASQWKGDLAVVRSGPTDAQYEEKIMKKDLVQTLEFYQDERNNRGSIYTEREKQRIGNKLGFDLSDVPSFSIQL
jgi:hypothetical protein